ncbi:hypothetical protein GCM10010344_23300 [Streptomyces bluensis]|nr:hypothetical protein GCM10010344_23300 [Streptomyces bluensis]
MRRASARIGRGGVLCEVSPEAVLTMAPTSFPSTPRTFSMPPRGERSGRCMRWLGALWCRVRPRLVRGAGNCATSHNQPAAAHAANPADETHPTQPPEATGRRNAPTPGGSRQTISP